MPLYQYKCKFCEYKFDEFSTWKKSKKVKCPHCKSSAQKLIPRLGALITDTSFCMTGKTDKRFGDKPIEGRADWDRRMKEKGLVELSQHDVKNIDDVEKRRKPKDIEWD